MNLDWVVGGDCVCLVGPGDSRKSTILDAVDLVLSPRWNVTFDDSDFFNADTSAPLSISATVGDLPEEWKSDDKFGLAVRGWSPAGDLHDEPAEGDEIVLTIRLQVDASLEPTWMVVNDRLPDGRPISARERERLGCTRLGDFLDRHLTWSRGSVLARLTGDVEEIGGVLAEAGRAARKAVDIEKLPAAIRKVALDAQTVGAAVGVSPTSSYRPHLDTQAASVGVGGLALHDGEVPVRRAGMGTRRLLTLGLQREAANAGGLVLVDEVEHGLEPHLIRRLLRTLRESHDDVAKRRGQVLMTTHSPTVLAELKAGDLRVVRCEGGATVVTVVPSDLQGIVLKAAEAFLGRRVIVCEGRTELGFCRGLNDWWSLEGMSFGYHGVALADGGGASAAKMAVEMRGLGYPVLYLGDADQEPAPTPAEMQAAGVEVLVWDGGVAFEQRLALDLPWEGVAEMVMLAMDTWGEERVRARVATELKVDIRTVPGDPSDWYILPAGEAAVRAAVGLAAKKSGKGKKGWFKQVDLAEPLAGLVRRHFGTVAGTDLGAKIASLKAWVELNG